ncbi:MAG TPA: tRNA lysidine(34) synthetase TilS [Kofleriaceae bacterium]
MPTMPRDPVSALRAAVKHLTNRLDGLYGLACSGGADSMALADALIAERGPKNVVLIHIDHGLSPHSAEIAAEVAAWAKGQGVAAIVRRVEVEKRASLEAAARDARYGALTTIADEIGAWWIWLGHTARDQAETVLMRIVRGTGPAGIAGIPMIRNRFVRPLLQLPRQLIEIYVRERALPTWDDPMNEDPRIARVRFRNTILPALRAENPAIDDALCRLAETSREWTDVIDHLARTVSRFPLSCDELVELEPAVRMRGYARSLEAEGLGYDAVHLDAIDDLAMDSSGGERGVDIPAGRVIRSYDMLYLHREHSPDPLVPPDAGFELRTWRAGDRMKPARLKGRSRKLSDLFIDAKVPRELRRTARVLVRSDDHVIVWAEHIGIAFGESPNVVPVPDRSSGSF